MLARIIDWISIVFLIFATVFAILVDFQPLYPSSTPLIKQIDKLFCDNYKSTLLCYNTPLWLQVMLYIELVFVFPMNLLGIYGMWLKRYWVKDYMLLLGIHLISTSIVYMVETYYNDESPSKMILVYSTIPYVVIPGLMVLRFLSVRIPYSGKVKFE